MGRKRAYRNVCDSVCMCVYAYKTMSITRPECSSDDTNGRTKAHTNKAAERHLRANILAVLMGKGDYSGNT